MEWVGCIRWKKIPKRLHGTNLSINWHVQPVLHRVSCSNETLPNAPKHYEIHQNMNLWSNGVERVRSLRKIPMRHRGKNFCINCTSSARFAPSFVQKRTIQNAPKHYKTQQYMSLGLNGVGRVHSLRKIPMPFRGKNFCINCTSSTQFATSFVRYFSPSFVQYRNNPKCAQTLRNAPIHEFRVQCGGSGAFVGKNSYAISWHELVHKLHRFNPFCTEFCVVTKHSQMHTNTMRRAKTWV